MGDASQTQTDTRRNNASIFYCSVFCLAVGLHSAVLYATMGDQFPYIAADGAAAAAAGLCMAVCPGSTQPSLARQK